MTVPCSMDTSCKNGVAVRGEQFAKCALCRLSPSNMGRVMAHHWVPIKSVDGRKIRHPQLICEKRLIKSVNRLQKLEQKRKRDPNKRKVLRRAAQAEKATERNIIHATQNSGRRNRDGDHIHGESITLDTKLQTTRENPVIQLAELEKVRADAMRSGKQIGGLVIRNKHNVGVVVLTESDFALLTKGLDESAH